MIPVILIHNGFQEYVKYNILQATKNNPVILLGDTNPNLEINNFEFVNYNNLLDGVDSFRFKYAHLSTNPFEYELFCYQRWFILRNFMKERNLEVIFYIDSDVLLFVDITKE